MPADRQSVGYMGLKDWIKRKAAQAAEDDKERKMKLLNCVLYLVLTALIGFLAGRIIPKKWLNPYAGIFCSFKFEQDGKLYEKLGIRKWQKLPHCLHRCRLAEAQREL